MKPETQPATDQQSNVANATDNDATAAKPRHTTEGKYDGGSGDGFHGNTLPDTTSVHAESTGTFLTTLNETDRSENKKMLSKEDEDLGIYEDTNDDEDDLSDAEHELERLRAEKKKRDREERCDFKAEEKTKDRKDRLTQNVRSLTESVIRQIQKQINTPRTDISMDSRVSNRSWSDLRCLQGFSIKDLCWKTGEDEGAFTTSMKAELRQSRNASRLALESREAMFRRAMTLLSARCTSVVDGEHGVSLGAQLPKYFYVTQDKPLPMEPLKAWRGYHGNIYFEPININPLKSDLDSIERARTSVTHQSVQPVANSQTRTAVPTTRAIHDKENRPLLDSRSESRQTNKSSLGSRRSSTRPLAFLDKQTVLTRLNDSIHEDIVWLEGTENTGSLAVRPRTYTDIMSRDKEKDLQHNKERIRKGSVAHKLFIDNKTKQKPKLSINGGKFTPPNSLSPLLRSQTQYSLSSHRLTTNSPDPYHLHESKLPALDQIRASLKHMDSRQPDQQRGKLPYNKTITLTHDMKPFVKYSPDVVAKFSQQAKILI